MKNFLNIPLDNDIVGTKDSALLADHIEKYLDKANKNYGYVTIEQVSKLNTHKLFKLMLKEGKGPLNPFLNNDYATQRLIMALGWNKPPKIVDTDTFNKIAKNNDYPIMYRGIAAHWPLEEEDIADDFMYGNVSWVGGMSSSWGVGLYFTTNRRAALLYGQTVIKSTLDARKVNIIDWDDLIDLARANGINNSGYAGGGDFADTDLLSVLAVQNGYNVIRINAGNNHQKGVASAPKSEFGDYYNVLDRGCMIVEKRGGKHEK